ncbi:MAG: DinB family protein [Pyrinomonadaceae bacterium]
MTPQDFEDLLEFLGDTPEFIRSLTASLTEGELRRKPAKAEFSFLEHVCHLRDIEQEGYRLRINKLLNEAEPFLPDIDGDKLARERNYNIQNFDEALTGFMRARKDNIQIIRNLPSDELNRSGTFQNIGIITLEQLLMMIREHDEAHRQALDGLLKEE